MSKKKEIPGKNPSVVKKQEEGLHGQQPDTPTRGDIKKISTDYVNPNNGAQQKSQKKT
ncbi:hypothetical protein GXP67_32940 [Rhodocytophaga rosea]|uniref:Uncharacterized protein n=1 Tax=Rhodocytophaga rosea TaxID=2704465 RepID=A0A6C0GUV4_9BACT|nr:hypothetical protein [Rhodocytophaga rosea]QHT71120.1 hypothetical protein GXP67_32940 [Rhodocytophaga rosea]